MTIFCVIPQLNFCFRIFMKQVSNSDYMSYRISYNTISYWHLGEAEADIVAITSNRGLYAVLVSCYIDLRLVFYFIFVSITDYWHATPLLRGRKMFGKVYAILCIPLVLTLLTSNIAERYKTINALCLNYNWSVSTHLCYSILEFYG